MKSELFLKKVLEHPENGLFRFSLGQALYQEGKNAEAIEHLRYCCEEKADWMMARLILGKAYMALGSNDEALPVLKEALELAVEQHHDDPAEEASSLIEEIEA